MAVAGCERVEQVGDDVAVETASLRCVPRDGATILGVAPNGELWLSTASGTRVLDLAGGDRTIAASLGDATHVLPWDASTASFVAGDALWSWRDGAREVVALPESVGAVRDLCGAPDDEHGVFVATDRGLFERDGRWWWQWSSGGAPLPPGQRVFSLDGACGGRDDTVWFEADDGELWQVSAASAAPVADARELTDLVGRRGGVAARFGSTLRLGPDWRDVELAGGEVVAMSGTYRRLWVATTAGMYSRTGAWSRIDGLPTTPPATIAAHAADGAWLAYDDELCHATIAPPILVRGLRPFERRRERTVELELAFVDHTETTAIVALDGAEVASAEIADGVARLPELALGNTGWHALSVRTGDHERLLDYYLLPGASRSWAADIEPLFQTYCAGGACHGPAPGGNRPDLSTYEGWQARYAQIRSRLLAGTMPPTDPRPTAAELDAILEWIEGGRLP